MPYDFIAPDVFFHEGKHFDLLLQEADGGLFVADVTPVGRGDAESALHPLDPRPAQVLRSADAAGCSGRILWCVDRLRFRVWAAARGPGQLVPSGCGTFRISSRYESLVDASRGEIVISRKQRIKRVRSENVASVIGWTGLCGLRSGISLKLLSGSHIRIHSAANMSIWDELFYYGWPDFELDVAWIRKIGSALAEFLHVNWIDHVEVPRKSTRRISQL
jgi:hypothetical protein